MRFVRRLWELSAWVQEVVRCVLGRRYPARIVGHARQRAWAIALCRAAAERVL